MFGLRYTEVFRFTSLTSHRKHEIFSWKFDNFSARCNIAGWYLQVACQLFDSALSKSSFSQLFDSQSLVCLYKKKIKKNIFCAHSFLLCSEMTKKSLVWWIMRSNRIIRFLILSTVKPLNIKTNQQPEDITPFFWFGVFLLTILGNECAFQQVWKKFSSIPEILIQKNPTMLHGKFHCCISNQIPVSCDEWRWWEKCYLSN